MNRPAAGSPRWHKYADELEATIEQWEAKWIVERAENKALRETLLEVVTISDRKHDAWDKAKSLLEKNNENES